MKITILSASPRNNGFSFESANYIHSYFKKNNIDSILLDIKNLNIHPCDGCGFCHFHKKCKFQDDFALFFDAINSCDLFFCITPVYFSGPPSQFKKLIDRCQIFWELKYTHNTKPFCLNHNPKGIVILYGGASHHDFQFKSTLDIIDIFYKSINTTIDKTFTFPNTDNIELSNEFLEQFAQTINLHSL